MYGLSFVSHLLNVVSGTSTRPLNHQDHSCIECQTIRFSNSPNSSQPTNHIVRVGTSSSECRNIMHSNVTNISISSPLYCRYSGNGLQYSSGLLSGPRGITSGKSSSHLVCDGLNPRYISRVYISSQKMKRL